MDHDKPQERLLIEAAPADLDAEAQAIADQIRERSRAAAVEAVKKRVTVSLSEGGQVRRNSPCPCGSGAKFKKCCLPAVKDPEDEKALPSPAALRAYMRNKKS